jgi:RNA polymerase-binding transcription factor DksA
MLDTSHAKARLQAQLAELKGRLAHLEAELGQPLDPDSSERAVEVEDDAALEGQAALVSQEIGSVTRALDRLESGTYGTCVECGGEIASARLEARPEAALCIACAK